MASISQGLVLTTAMVLSSTALYLAFQWKKTTPTFQIHGIFDSHHSNKQTLRSCLCSEEKKKERKMKRRKKRVQFADNVMEAREMSEEVKEKQRNQNRVSSNCRHENSENRQMPANRIALYNGILREKVHKMGFSY